MKAIRLKTNHLVDPIGIDAGSLFLSWQCAEGVYQTAYPARQRHDRLSG